MQNTDPSIMLRYALMLKLPTGAIQRVKELQNSFRKDFAFPNALVSHPHMTLAYWEMDPRFESRLFSLLEIQASEIAPQRLFFNGFEQLSGAFCVGIEKAQDISGRIFEKKGYLRKRLKAETMVSKVEFVSRIHVTIARKLTLDQLKSVSEAWRARRFQQDVIADSMFLIKYLPNGDSRVIGEFTFSAGESSGKPVAQSIQIPLFSSH